MPGSIFGIPVRPTAGQGVTWSELLGGRMDVGTLLGPASGLSGLTLNRIPFGNTTGGLQDSSSLTWDGTTFAVTGLATVSGTLTVTGQGIFSTGATFGSDAAAGVSFTVNAAAGAERSFWFRTANVTRWKFYCDSTAEAGADAGSNLALAARSDAGTLIGNVLTVVRAAGGAMTLSRPIVLGSTLQLGNAYIATPQVSTGYVTLLDSTGTTYKVLVAP